MALPFKKSVATILTSAFLAASQAVPASHAQDHQLGEQDVLLPSTADELISNEFLREMLGFLDVVHFQLEDQPHNLISRIVSRKRMLQNPQQYMFDQDDIADLESLIDQDVTNLMAWLRDNVDAEVPELRQNFGSFAAALPVTILYSAFDEPSNVAAICHQGVPVCFVMSAEQSENTYDSLSGTMGTTLLSAPDTFRVMDVWHALFEAAYIGQGYECIEVGTGGGPNARCEYYYPDLTLMAIHVANSVSLMTDEEMDNYFLLRLTHNVTRTGEFLAPYELMTYYYYLQGITDADEINERLRDVLISDLDSVRDHIHSQIVYNPEWGAGPRSELKQYLADVITGEELLLGEAFSNEARFFAGAMLMMYERRGDTVPDLGDIPLYGHNLADFVDYLHETSTAEPFANPVQNLQNITP